MLSARSQSIFRSIYSISTFLLLVYFIFSYYSIGNRPWIFYTADNIYIPYLYQDLIEKGGSLLQWKFSPVPYFFPDMLIYFILAALTQHLKIAIVLFAVVQLTLYYWLIVGIGKIAVKETTLFHLSVFTSLLLFAGGYLQQEAFYILVSQEHFGTALMFLLGIWLIAKSFLSPQKSYYVYLFLICFLTIISDVVFVTQFITTAIASLCFMLWIDRGKNKRIYLTNIAILITSFISAYLIYRLKFFVLHMSINPHLIKRASFSELAQAVTTTHHNISIFYQQNAVLVLLLIIYFIFSLVFLVKKMRKQQDKDKIFTFIIMSLFMSMVMGLLSLIFVDNNLMNAGYEGLRHSQPYLLFPVFLGIPLYLTQYTNLNIVLSRYYIYLLIAILSCAYLFTPKGSIKNILNFYPASLACIDQYAEKLHLKNGASDYWKAKSYTFLSKQHLNIVALENNHKKQDIEPQLWMNTAQDYKNRNFNFLIMSDDSPESLDKTYVQAKYGTPLLQLQCPALEKGGTEKIFIYKNNVINQDWILAW